MLHIHACLITNYINWLMWVNQQTINSCRGLAPLIGLWSHRFLLHVQELVLLLTLVEADAHARSPGSASAARPVDIRLHVLRVQITLVTTGELNTKHIITNYRAKNPSTGSTGGSG